MQSYAEIENKYLFNVYTKRNITLIRGKNATVWDEAGKQYIDCVSGHGVSNLGHGNERLMKAITEQAGKMITCSNVFYNDARAGLLERLIQITPAKLTRAFFCNSGTEAIEAALKFSRFATHKTDFICAEGAFHGRSFGAMSATFKQEYKAPYEPLVPGFSFTPYNDFEKLQELVTERTAGVILEPVQGEGGVNIGGKEFLHNVQTLCHERGIIFIIDEIQTGFCRTGKMFVSEYFDIQPDILCMAKAMAGGLPMGAVLCSDEIEVPVGRHGTTFGGNPLCCAAAVATIDYMLENDIARQAEEKGKYFTKKMSGKKLGKIREIRHLGLMIGIELNQENKPVIQACQDRGLLIFPAGTNVLRVFPPLTITYDDLDKVVEVLQEVLA